MFFVLYLFIYIMMLTKVEKQCKHVDIIDEKKTCALNSVFIWTIKRCKVYLMKHFNSRQFRHIFIANSYFPCKILSRRIKLYIKRNIPNCFYIEHPYFIVYLISNLLSSFASGHLRMKKLRTSILGQTFFASIYTQFYLCLLSNWKTTVI